MSSQSPGVAQAIKDSETAIATANIPSPVNPAGSSALGSTVQDLEKQLLKSAGPSFMLGMRITQSVSEAFKDRTADLGEYTLGKSNLGRLVKALIGPRRWTAMRLRDGNLDLIDHNLTTNSKYNAQSNEWLFPDGFTPNFREIKDRKMPDMGQKLVNLVGYEYLLYLPTTKEFCTFYCAKTALTMTKTDDIVKVSKGKIVIFGSEEVGKQNRWYVPKVQASAETMDWPNNEEGVEALTKFLEPGVKYDPQAQQTRTR